MIRFKSFGRHLGQLAGSDAIPRFFWGRNGGETRSVGGPAKPSSATDPSFFFLKPSCKLYSSENIVTSFDKRGIIQLEGSSTQIHETFDINPC
jgi:hypothetical protein